MGKADTSRKPGFECESYGNGIAERCYCKCKFCGKKVEYSDGSIQKWCAREAAMVKVIANADATIREAISDLRFKVASAGAAEELGEGATVGRRGSSMSAVSTFAISEGSNRAGNDEEDEQDLGQELSLTAGGRRASAASASSFILSAGSNRAGNDEEDDA